MKLPKQLLYPKLSEQDLIALLDNLGKQKARAIKDQQYQKAADIRDQERKYRGLLEELINSDDETDQ